MSEEKSLTLAGIPVRKSGTANKRFNLMLWGRSGCGKTTLAATSPSPILWLLFDPGGDKSIPERDDVIVLDMSDQGCEILNKMKIENPLGIESFIKDRNIKTVVLDSLTTLSDRAIEHAVKYGAFKQATIESPTLGGYGHRQAVVLNVVRQLLRSCARCNANCVLIAHEDSPKVDDKGNVLFISIMLGGAMAEKAGLHLDEIWHMTDTGKDRRILVRPARMRQPMKSRMFQIDKPEFVWKFDADKWEGEGIKDWYNRWSESNGKIPVPA